MKQNRISVFIAVALIGVIAAAFVASPPKASAQTSNPVSVVTYPDLTGNGAAQRIASSGTCRIIDVAALPANNAAVRIGDINVGASRGLPIAPGGYVHFEFPYDPGAVFPHLYSLASMYVYAASGDKVSVTCQLAY
jgi:hypothetical protein